MFMNRLVSVPQSFEVVAATALDGVNTSLKYNNFLYRGFDKIPSAPNVYGRRNSSVLVPFYYEDSERLITVVFPKSIYPANAFGFAVSSLMGSGSDSKIALLTTINTDPTAGFDGMKFDRRRFENLDPNKQQALKSLANIVLNAATSIPNRNARALNFFGGGWR